MADLQAGSWTRHGSTRRRLVAPALTVVGVIVACIALPACETAQPRKAVQKSAARVVPDVPITQGRYVVGQPYRQNGVWYHPAEDWSYNEVGKASWYGINHHGKRTANGETFDLRALTAAHPTLPLPTRVRVTNIENGKSVEVRVNDRGPFIEGRLIDLSERAADALGFKDEGTAMVRVEMLGRAPLEVFRMAKPKGNAPDLPVRPAPSADVKAAVLPPPSTSVEESATSRTATAAHEEEDFPQALADPVEELINQMTSKAETDDAAVKAGDGETTPAVEAATSSANQQLFIQAGAFTVPENAYSLRRLIMKALTQATVSINPAQVGEREFFRVRLGPFASREEANGILAQLRNLGQNDAKIVSD